MEVDWNSEADRLASTFNRFPEPRRLLAEQLHLPEEAFAAMRIGCNGRSTDGLPNGGWWSFPECDGSGKVIGIKVRTREGDKFYHGTSNEIKHSGLSIPDGWKERDGPVLLVEGATDTLAGTHAGLSCVGRPDKESGIEYLTELLKDWPADRHIFVVGENDQKPPSDKHPNGLWEGRKGAESTARRLMVNLQSVIHIVFPPDGAKDIREWLTSADRDEQPWPERGLELLTKMMKSIETIDSACTPPGENRIPPPEGGDPARWADKPENCHRLAAKFLASLSLPGQPSPLRHWREEFHEWKDGCYHTVPESDMKSRLSNWIRNEFLSIWYTEHELWQAKSADERGPSPKTREATRWVVGNVRDALGGMCSVDSTVDAPMWLDGANGPDPKQLVALRNGVYDVTQDHLIPPTPSYFTFAATEFDFDPHAPEPAEWLKFIASCWPTEQDTRACLQEWMGYLLTPDNSQQKYLYLLGVPRSGKSLTTNVIQQLVGKKNTTGIKLPSLARQFGLEDLLNKSVGFVGDARLSKNDDVTAIQGAILNIAGDDPQSVARKHKTSVNCHLPTRLVFTSNEMPSWIDASGAVSARMILLRYSITHEGNEDVGLLKKLLSELPGIFLWTMEGFRRLRERGHFVMPTRSKEDVQEIREAAAPIRKFVNEKCVLGPKEWCWSDDLWKKWNEWRKAKGEPEMSDGSFGKLLRIAFPDVSISKNKKDKHSDSGYRTHRKGIRLRHPGETDGIVIEDETEAGDDYSDLFGDTGEGVKGDEGQFSTNSETRRETEKHPGNAGVGQSPYGETYSGEGVTRFTPSPAPRSAGWLYVSRKLALEYLPDSQVGPTVQFGTEVFFRITPNVLVWFEYAIATLLADSPTQHDTGESIAAQQAMHAFARDRFPGGALDDARAEARARGKPKDLPPPEWVPDLANV